jgi:hypothetical protein
MRHTRALTLAATASATLLIAACATQPSSGPSFFITSTGSGKGADLGGLAGADKLCQALATAAGLPQRTWRAYLSTSGTASVNARDRIGSGPWTNVKGVLIAADVAQLHSADNNLNKQTALTEKGGVVNASGDTPNMHDILTGSSPEGRTVPGDKDTTCSNWTSSGEGSAIVGHHNRAGLDDSAAAKSWNSSHPSRGCSPAALQATGGNGLIYCFAAN